jgi:hypothetical protein
MSSLPTYQWYAVWGVSSCRVVSWFEAEEMFMHTFVTKKVPVARCAVELVVTFAPPGFGLGARSTHHNIGRFRFHWIGCVRT